MLVALRGKFSRLISLDRMTEPGANEATLQSRITRRILRSFSAQIVFFVVRFVQQILLVPLFLASWGTLAYADWLLLSSLAAFASFIDFGMQIYFSNRLQATWAKGNTAGHQRVFSTMLGAHLLVIGNASAIVAVLAIAANPVAWLNLRTIPHDDAAIILWLLAAAVIVGIIQGIFVQLYRARQKFDRAVNAGTLLILLQAGAIGTSLLFLASPLTMAWANLGATVLSGVLIFYDCKRLYPDIRYVAELPDRTDRRAIYANAPYYTLSSLAVLGVQNGPILVIGQFATEAGAIVSFSLLRTITNLIRMIANQFAMSSTVEIVHQYLAGGERGPMRRLFFGATATITAIVGAPSGLLWVMGSLILAIWSRGQASFDRGVFDFLLLATVLAASTQIPIVFLSYTNHPRPMAAANVALLVFGVGLGIPLTSLYGAAGMAASLFAVEAILFLGILSRVACELIGVSYIRFIGISIAAMMLALVPSIVISAYLTDVLRPTTITTLAIFGFAWGGLMTLCMAAVAMTARKFSRLR